MKYLTIIAIYLIILMPSLVLSSPKKEGPASASAVPEGLAQPAAVDHDAIEVNEPGFVASRNAAEKAIAEQIKEISKDKDYVLKKTSWGLLSKRSKDLIGQIIKTAPQTPIYIDGVDKQLMAYDWRGKDFLFLTHSRSLGSGYAQTLVDYKNRIAANGMKIPADSTFHFDIMPYMSVSLSDQETTAFGEKTGQYAVSQIVLDIDGMASLLTFTVDAYSPQARGGLANTITTMLTYLKRELDKKEAKDEFLSANIVMQNTLYYFNEILVSGNHLAKEIGATKPITPIAMLVPDSNFNIHKIEEIVESERPNFIKARQEFMDALDLLSRNGIPIILVSYQSKGSGTHEQSLKFDHLLYSKERGNSIKILSLLTPYMLKDFNFKNIEEYQKALKRSRSSKNLTEPFGYVGKEIYFADNGKQYAHAVNMAIESIIQLKNLFNEKTDTGQYRWEKDVKHRMLILSKIYRIEAFFKDSFIEEGTLTIDNPQSAEEQISDARKYVDLNQKSKVTDIQLSKEYMDEYNRLVAAEQPTQGAAMSSRLPNKPSWEAEKKEE